MKRTKKINLIDNNQYLVKIRIRKKMIIYSLNRKVQVEEISNFMLRKRMIMMKKGVKREKNQKFKLLNLKRKIKKMSSMKPTILVELVRTLQDNQKNQVQNNQNKKYQKKKTHNQCKVNYSQQNQFLFNQKIILKQLRMYGSNVHL